MQMASVPPMGPHPWPLGTRHFCNQPALAGFGQREAVLPPSLHHVSPGQRDIRQCGLVGKGPVSHSPPSEPAISLLHLALAIPSPESQEFHWAAHLTITYMGIPPCLCVSETSWGRAANQSSCSKISFPPLPAVM